MIELYYVKKGKLHERECMECQDAVYSSKKGSVKVIALADGAGDNDFGRKGAELTARTMAEFLCEHFEELYTLSREDLQYNMIVNVRNALYEYCDSFGTRLDELQSTILAFAYDNRRQRAIMAHLGDGYIVALTNQRYRIISYPKNIGNRHCTYLTSMIPVADKLNIFCGIVEGLQKVFLLSDGWCEFIHQDEEIIDIVQSGETGGFQRKGWDDISVICMNVENQ